MITLTVLKTHAPVFLSVTNVEASAVPVSIPALKLLKKFILNNKLEDYLCNTSDALYVKWVSSLSHNEYVPGR